MYLAEANSFLSAVLNRMGIKTQILETIEIDIETGYWGDVCAYNMTTSDNQNWHIVCRVRQKPLPSNYIDFLEIENTQQHLNLIVVYLDAEENALSALDLKYIPANRWQSVTHIDWTQKHPFKSNKVNVLKISLKSADSLEREGGTRKNKTSITPLISIVTIVLNGDEYLEQTIQSVIHQKGLDVEYVVVDGGSTDGSLKIINQYANYIDYWISEPDKGLYDALNRGINLCRGEFVGAIHSNDFYTSGTIAELKKSISQYPETSFFYGNLWYLDTNRYWLRGREISTTFQMVTFGDFFHPTSFINRQAYLSKGTYDLTYQIAADYDLGIRFWKAGLRFRYIPKALAYFRLGGISGNLYRNQWQRHLVRVASGELYLYSLFIMILVLSNYYLKSFGEMRAKFFR